MKLDVKNTAGSNVGQIDLAEVHAQYQAIRREYPAEAGYRLHFRPSFELADLVRYRDSEEFPVPEPRCRIPWYNLNVNPAGEVKCSREGISITSRAGR